MRMTRLESATQRRSRREQMSLSGVFVQRGRTQAIGKRTIGAAGGHWTGRPMTSTPGGGVNMNRSGISWMLRLALVKVSCVT